MNTDLHFVSSPQSQCWPKTSEASRCTPLFSRKQWQYHSLLAGQWQPDVLQSRPVPLFCLLLGPEQVSTCEVPIVFVVMIFLLQIISFFTAWTHLRTHQTWNIRHTCWKNSSSSPISTTSWRYNQGKCVLPYNSHILCRTFRTFSPRVYWIVPISAFFSANSRNVANLLFRTPPGDFTSLHETLQVAAVDRTYQKLSPTLHLVAVVVQSISALRHKAVKSL